MFAERSEIFIACNKYVGQKIVETLIKTKKRPEKYTRQKKEIRKPSDPVKRGKLLGAEEVHIEGDQLKQIIKGDQKANKNRNK